MKFLRWALWSRNHLIAAAAMVFGGMLTLSVLAAALAPTPAPDTTTTANGQQEAEGEPVLTFDLGEQQVFEGSPAEQVAATAEAFLTAWQDRALDSLDWIEGMRPYATTSLLTRMYGTDPTDVPAAQLRDLRVEAVHAENALVLAQFKGFELYVSLEPAGDGWKVNAVNGGDDHADH